MIFSFVFQVTLILCTHSLVQLRPYIFQDGFLKEKFSGLQHFSVNAFNFTHNYQIVLFGGLLNGTSQNQLIFLNIPNKTSRLLQVNGAKPPPRSNHCSISHEYKLYIYGGRSENQTLKDLWSFNSIFQQWTYLGSSPDLVTSCRLIVNNTNILIFGLDNNRFVKIIKFNSVESNWSILSYKYAKYVKFYGKNILNRDAQTVLSIQSLGQSLLNESNIIFIESLRTSSLNIRSYNGTNILLLTNSSILRLQLTTLNIYFVRKIEFHKNIEKMQISERWLFLMHYVNNNICLEYFQKNDLHFNGYTTYKNPENSTSYQTFIFDGDIFFISQTTFSLYIIQQHCQWIQNFTHIHACFYNEIICQEGFTGPICNITSCPNTLALFDSANFMQIKMQCSNHGECTEAGCLCNIGWTGEDCSIFQSITCKGQVVHNWPVTNCECLNQTTGGNNCEVTFCYNDCSDHGKCSNQGACICDLGYYGQDCSITIIQFPSASLSI